MDKCLVYGCPNSLEENDTSVHFYYFPKDPLMAQQWLHSCCVWNADGVDLNTALICSVHFDHDSYTSEYKMIDHAGYTRILKYDAVPTLFLPQQTVVYRVANVENDNFTDQNYEASSIFYENTQHQPQQEIEGCVTKYEELPTVPLQSTNGWAIKTEESVVEEKNKTVTSYKQLQDVKTKNDRMKKEVLKLEQNINTLKKKLTEKMEEYKKRALQCNKLRKTLSNLEMKSMSLSDQKNLLSKVFSKSQIAILSGKKKIYWSHDDMAIASTIRRMSSRRFYAYLSKKMNIPFPALSSIQRWEALKKTELMKEEKSEKDDKNEDSDEMT